MKYLSAACSRINHVLPDLLLDVLGFRMVLNWNSRVGGVDVAKKMEIEDAQKCFGRRRIEVKWTCHG